MKKLIAGLAASAIALGAATATAAQCTNDVWNKVMQRGKIVIGVKADYKPWVLGPCVVAVLPNTSRPG